MPNVEFISLKKDLTDIVSFPPRPAITSRPEWWVHMPKNIDSAEAINYKSNRTIRACPAVNDAFNFGYIMYTPVDIYLDATEEDNIVCKIPELDLSVYDDDSRESFFDHHARIQTEKYFIDENYCKQVLKMNTLWGVKTDEGYSTWFTHPIGRSDLPFRVFDGIIDTDKCPSVFPYAFIIKKGFKGIIKAGTPFMQVIPFKRDDFSHTFVEKDLHQISQNANALKVFFSGGYKKIFWSRKKFT